MAEMKKKTLLSENPLKEGDRRHKKSRLSETVKKWAAFLVAHGMTETEAARRINTSGCLISQASVSKAYRAYFNEDSPFPIPTLTIEEFLDNTKKIYMLFQLEVLYQLPENRDWREISLIKKTFIDTLKEHEELRESVNLRDEILSLERIMAEEELPEEALEILQARYNRLNEEM